MAPDKMIPGQRVMTRHEIVLGTVSIPEGMSGTVIQTPEGLHGKVMVRFDYDIPGLDWTAMGDWDADKCPVPHQLRRCAVFVWGPDVPECTAADFAIAG